MGGNNICVAVFKSTHLPKAKHCQVSQDDDWDQQRQRANLTMYISIIKKTNKQIKINKTNKEKHRNSVMN